LIQVKLSRHKPLDIVDARLVEAAKGWCELYAFDEAERELGQVSADKQDHPEVLEVRWQFCMNLERWEQALDQANAIRRLEPEQPEGWIYSASTLVTLDRHLEAFEILDRAVGLFPEDEIINYDLASVCCMLGRIEEARKWLARAFEFGGDEVKQRALDDSDLGPLWRLGGDPG